MEQLLSQLSNFLISQENNFTIETNRLIQVYTCNLYGFRKAGMAGRDYLFIHDLRNKHFDLNYCKSVHDDERSYVNAQYKLPRIMRFKVPNIITVFINDKPFSADTCEWVGQNTRPLTGGEFHATYLIDISNHTIQGQGRNQVVVKGGRFEFGSIDPQNRAYHLVQAIGKLLFTGK